MSNYELMMLIKENPNLKIMAWVDYEVVGDDTSSRWLGSFGDASVKEFTSHQLHEYEEYGRLVYKDDTEELEEYLAEYKDMTDKEIQEYIKDIKWDKAIFIDVDLPN